MKTDNMERNLSNGSQSAPGQFEYDTDDEEELERVRLVGASSASPTFPRMSCSQPSSSQRSSFNEDQPVEDRVVINRPVLNNSILYADYPRYNGKEGPPRTCLGTITACFKRKWEQRSCNPLAWFLSLFPIFVWLPAYQWKKNVTYDAIAGFTVAVMHIPQGMAYAQLANLPPIIGIYMGFFPVIMYSLVGTSRHVSMGTFAVVCLMTGKVALEKLGDYSFVSSTVNDTIPKTPSMQKDFFNSYYTGGSEYSIVEIATAISFCVGIWQVAMGVLKLGSLSLLLSSELVSGFTTGAAIHVLTSQMKSMLGISVPKRSGIFKIPVMWVDVFSNIAGVNFMALGLSVITVVSLLTYNEIVKPNLCKSNKLPLPVELITVVFGTLISYIFELHENYGIEIVNHIPTGFPEPVFPPMKVVPNVIWDSFIIAAVAYVISVSMAKTFAVKHNYTVKPNQELFANGTSNLIGSCFSCAPICASLSRSSIQEQVGGKTQLAGLFSCGILVFVLLWLGPYFQTLPSCILSGMIIVALKGMFVQVNDLPTAWKESMMNGSVWLVTFISTIILDIEYGLGIGLCMSVALLVLRSNKPKVFLIGSYGSTDVYIDLEKSELAQEVPELRIIKGTGSLNYATVEKFLVKLKNLVPLPEESEDEGDGPSRLFKDATISPSGNKSLGYMSTIFDPKKCPKPEHWIILDFSSVSAVDPAAVKGLRTTISMYAQKRVQMFLCGCCVPVLDTMSTCGLIGQLGADNYFPHVQDAVARAQVKLADLQAERLKEANLEDANQTVTPETKLNAHLDQTLNSNSKIVTIHDNNHVGPQPEE